MVRVEGLQKRFGEVHALAGLDLEVAEGQVLGLLGPNGAGKTTLVRILATLMRPDGGRAQVAGFDVVDEPVAVRRSIGLAGQYAAVDDALTGRENLEMIGQLSRLSRADARTRAVEILDRLSLADAGDRLVRTYSGGMRRRLDLGASVVSRPRVLLFDEPTTGLDPRARLELWTYLQELVAEGASLLLTTQHMEEADYLADDIAVIDHGQLIAHGSPAELKRQLGGDVLDVVVATRDALDRAATVLTGPDGIAPEVDEGGLKVSVHVGDSAHGTAQVVRLLDDAGIGIAELLVRRPSLDDVFLTLVGHLATTDATTDSGDDA